jgi:ubiquinone/menaquinone biosynthesis C-methylase UbiE
MKTDSSLRSSPESCEWADSKSLKSLGYSLRRYFVDEFHFRHVQDFQPGSRVLDLGGNGVGKRGFFDIEGYDLQVLYANLSAEKVPDVRTEASGLPFRDNAFDGIICSELLEHVSSPPAVLRDIHRVLRVGGLLLICVPFLNRIHGDPYDFGRYTDHYWLEALGSAGFSDILIEKQGFFWCVLMDMIRDFAYQKTGAGGLSSQPVRRFIESAVYLGKRSALAWDRSHAGGDTWHQSFTTGFGIKARKL